MLVDPGVHQHIAGAAIKAAYCAVAGQNTQIGHAAYIDDDAVALSAGKSSGMKSGHQGGALPPGSDITAAEIGDGGDAGELGEGIGVANLQREGFFSLLRI